MTRTIRTLLALSLAFSLPSAIAGEEHHEGEHHSPFEGQPLLTLMHNMQYYGHKLGLAIDAGNSKLMGFYVHEVEEVIEAVSEIESYDGIAISTLLESTLEPRFEALEAAIEVGDPARIDTAYDQLLDGCNACHTSANRPYLVIERNRDNPYPQRFTPEG
jgi:hypothetical protein